MAKAKKTHPKGMKTKEKICREAFKLFLTMPYELVTIQEIENKIDVTRGSIFYHLKDKHDLFEQIIENYFIKNQNVYSLLNDKILEKDITFLEFIDIYISVLQQKVDALYEFVELNKKNMTQKEIAKKESFYMGMMLTTGYYLDDYNERMNANFNIEKNTWSFFIQKAIEKGEIKPNTNVKLFGEIFTSVYFGKSCLDAYEKGLSTKELKELYVEIYDKIKV
jgi:AcrR family transcriptional regulator